MKKLLYIGNHLQNSRTNASYSAVLGPSLERSGYNVRYASNRNNKVFRLLEMLWITYKTRKTTDLVLIDTYSTQNFYYAVLVGRLCKRLKLPYIPILHGGNLPERLENSPKLSQRLFENAYANVSPSLYLKSSFEHFGYKNVLHIPNVINIAAYPFHRKTLETPKLLWVRSFSEIYNPKLAVQVLFELQQQGYNATLCMVGPDTDGSLAEVMALAERLNVKVDFTGKLTKQEWIALSRKYNVFINTTNFDNMPVSVIEAMALGLPIVSTNVGGMPYLIENGVDGILVPSEDTNAMVEAICALFKNGDHTEIMVEKARAKVERFDWKVVRKQWERILNKDYNI